MSVKTKLKLVGGFLILLIILSIVNLFLPKIEIELNGEKIINLNLGEEYIEYGAKANLNKIFKLEDLKVDISGKVNTDKVGKYIVVYKSSTDYQKKEVIRIINVLDTIKPEIKLESKVNACKKNNLLDYNIKATDNYDGDITNKIKYQIKNDEIIFSVSDNSNNKTEITEKLHYIDNEYPKITLKGSENIDLLVGDSYEEFGATAFDSCDGDLTNKIKISHQIDINKPGIYDVDYLVSDQNNKTTKIKRYVTIKEKEEENKYEVINGATIYLTFDDGPGPYTEELLNILDEYNIKATFFVTAQFPKYRYLIGEEYKRGHAIGIHTYSHKWSIYQSEESYLEDFNKIDNIIFEETGIHPNIFRFPGGSSNKVSRNYSKGIMTRLSKLMESKGYIYFDWTFDSGDTSKNKNSVKDIIQNFKMHLKGDGEYVVLLHDIKNNTIKAMPEIIKYALANGYTFDKLGENSPVEHFEIAN